MASFRSLLGRAARLSLALFLLQSIALARPSRVPERELRKVMDRIELQQQTGSTPELRRELATVGRSLRGLRSDRWFALQDRYRSAVARAQLPRATERTSDFRLGLLRAHSGQAFGLSELARLEAGLTKAGPGASRPARQLLDLYFSKTAQLDPAARERLSTLLQERGYPVQIAATAGAARRGNVNEDDRAFSVLSRRAGKHGGLAIGVIDGGFDPTHPTLAAKLWTNPAPTKGDVHGWSWNVDGGGGALDGRGYDPMGIVDGGIGHGTHVAGIASRGTNRVKMIGLAHTNIEVHAQAMRYAVEQGARIVHFSQSIWGADKVQDALAVIRSNPGVLFVQSAGNNGRPLGAGRLSSAEELAANDLPNFIRVSAADPRGKRQDTSNYGLPFSTIAAPAEHYSSTSASFSPSRYVYTGKTSQAAPYVTNVAAKCLLLAPGLKPVEVKQLIIDTAARSTEWSDKVVAGGLVSPRRAYRLAALVGLCREGAAPTQAASKLGLTGRERARMLALLPRYLPPLAP